MAMSQRLGQAAYGTLFVVLLPGLLATWAWQLDQSHLALWPVPFPSWSGTIISLAGLGLMTASMHALWVFGKGLPMNAYPPENYVCQSVYAWFSHPIYLGFCALVAGISIIAGSPGGLWVVTPVTALSCAALVIGYERPNLERRFGTVVTRSPLLGLPERSSATASLHRRLLACAVALCPWAIAYAALSQLPAPYGAQELRQAWEAAIPGAGWAIWVYSASYPIAIAAPLLLRTHLELRRYVIGAWLATLSGLGLMLFAPGKAEFLPTPGSDLTGLLTEANRLMDADWLACPSFHMIWIVLAALCFRQRFPHAIAIPTLTVIAIGASCLLTGSHAAIDIVIGTVFGFACWHHELLWAKAVKIAETLGNSWNAIELGPIRIINHAAWSAIAAGSGFALAIWMAGLHLAAPIAGVFLTALITAGVWGYWLEGGGRLSRPFGYYGFLFGAIGAIAVLALVDGDAAQIVMAAFACAAPMAQAIGRFRCLIQGCCHGRPVVSVPGIRITHPMSRVSALSELHGISIHPTQLYSIVANLAIFAVLWRQWETGATAFFIGGLYLALSSLARFAEEGYRGEAQTPHFGGLAIYQWLAIALYLIGIGLSMIDGNFVHLAANFSWTALSISMLAALLAAFLMSIDFPHSEWRFSRLTVSKR